MPAAAPKRESQRQSILTRRRFQFAIALVMGAVLPLMFRWVLPAPRLESATYNTFFANIAAVAITFWLRLSIEIYPGIRRSAVILPASLIGHGMTVLWFAMTRFPYDRVGLALGFGLHVFWLYIVYVYGNRLAVRRYAVVPFGNLDSLLEIELAEWRLLKRPNLGDVRSANAIVADFSSDLPDEWEAFLADAALAGRIVYQVKQLSESLTGRVELDHLSENSFGSLLPASGYFHFKALADFLVALLALPIVLPLSLAIGLAVRLDSKGPVLFRQRRVGHAGRPIVIYKFRTMHPVALADDIEAAKTGDDDARITKVGRFLRRMRLDELPQIINILKWQMSWIGPRPEAEILSRWYTSEIPFYRYRHVVKPGISGWAQVNQGHVAEVDEVHRKLQYDFYYIKYYSPWLDMLILFRTAKTMLSGFGAR
jgi:lipopolysaccharide/colanic/teichoic acid biosynthesis glycosyltransferase